MKRYSLIIHTLSLACAGLIAGCATNQPGAATAPPPNSGHVIINRVANFGTDLSLVVSVDARTWEALPKAEVTMATCRQASTLLRPG